MDFCWYYKVYVKKDVNKYMDDREKGQKYCFMIWCRCDILRGGFWLICVQGGVI